MDLRSAAVIGLTFFSCLAFGCATTITPDSFDAEAPELPGAWRGPVSVVSLAQENPHPRFNANGIAFEVDLNSFSANLAELVSDSLRSAGTEVGSGGKRMRVEVVLLDFMFQGPCFLDYSVHLGNGEVFGQQTIGESSVFTRACRKALEAAVPLILEDARTVGYLGGH